MATKAIVRNGKVLQTAREIESYWRALVNEGKWVEFYDHHNGSFYLGGVDRAKRSLIENKVHGRAKAVAGSSFPVVTKYDPATQGLWIILPSDADQKTKISLAQQLVAYEGDYGYRVAVPTDRARIPVEL